jgi:hypothetical protein
MTDAELVDYFNEHVFYELLMLRHSKQCIQKADTQIIWNTMFAAFNVSARNLYDFLNNKGDRQTDVNVDDYKLLRTDTRRGSISDVQGTLQMLNAQCFHMGNQRSKEVDKKVSLDRIRTMSAWVVSNMDDLLKSFRDDFRSKLRPEWAGLVDHKSRMVVGVLGPMRPSLNSTTSIIATGPTGTGDVIQFDTPKK